MGEQKVTLATEGTELQDFVRRVLRDLEALEYMIEHDWFEKDICRIGAEQEMFLIDPDTYRPAPVAMEALASMKRYPWVETELAKFNLEIGLSPRDLTGRAFSQMYEENVTRLGKIKEKLKECQATLILCGILPTLRKHDLEMHNLTPKKRYKALMEALDKQRLGDAYELRLRGIDELLVKHESPLLEACNTSFQVHLQVHPSQFVKLYNIAQALAGPVMAIGANSPIVFGKRLWHESRIALFQQSIDTRASSEHLRQRSPRVQFGKSWLEGSILEIYRDDLARFRALLAADQKEDALALIQKGKVPKLRALQVFNSTIYRWNRPCYGISANGKPHLRIENRVLPAGPTVLDEMANAAFWVGCMLGMAAQIDDIRKHLGWEDVRDNFGKAAQFGIDSNFNWFGESKIGACELVLKELLPIARKGLESHGIHAADIDRFLGLIEERARKHMNGARWQLRAYTRLLGEVTRDEALTVLTATIWKNQQLEMPVHNWPMPDPDDLEDYLPTELKVEEFMTTDLITVQLEDPIELVAQIMDWRRIRHMPVEDAKGKLAGLITSRLLLRHFNKARELNAARNLTAADIMVKEPITIEPGASIIDAMNLMRTHRIGSLPVVKEGELVGLITEMDFLRITARLLERLGHKRKRKQRAQKKA